MWHSSWVSGYWVNVSTKPTQQLLKQTKIVLLCCRCLANIIRMSGNRNTPISLKFLSKFCRPNQTACYRNPQRFHLISINVTSHLFTVVWRVFGYCIRLFVCCCSKSTKTFNNHWIWISPEYRSHTLRTNTPLGCEPSNNPTLLFGTCIERTLCLRLPVHIWSFAVGQNANERGCF